MSKITVRPATEKDNFLRIALCIYSTDPFIYPAAFGYKQDKATQAIAALMQIDDNLFHYSNILVACSDNQICGVLLYNKSGAKWDDKACNTAVKDYIPDLDHFIYVSKTYFAAESVCPLPAHIEIVACSVLPEFRKVGVASMMLSWLFNQNKGNVFTLDVLADNPAAIALYTKCGFTINARTKGFSINTSARPDCYRMIREV